MIGSISFLGAARNVTGSRTLLEIGGARILVDCGMFQERDFQDRNWDPFPIEPASLDAVLLTHGHLDHCGLLPKLAHEGFRGTIFATSPTAEIAAVVMDDSARLQEEDAVFKRKRHQKEGRESPRPVRPLYDVEDVEKATALFKPIPYGQSFSLPGGGSASFHEAGHVLGSSMIRAQTGSGADARVTIFSGDLGRWDKPILRDPTLFEAADYVVMESTYGDRLHAETHDVESDLAAIINETFHQGGNLVIPVFAIERAQEVLYVLSRLIRKKRIPELLVFLDSPMAVKVTAIFEKHPELYDQATTALLANGESPFHMPGLKQIRDTEASKAINNIRGTAIIMAGSGMCTGGRIKHHLAHNLSRPESAVLFVGYQAAGTLGRELLDGARSVRLFGKKFDVRARIEKLSAFSGHADRSELLRWAANFRTPPRRAFVIHGEATAAAAFAKELAERLQWTAEAPEFGQRIELE